MSQLPDTYPVLAIEAAAVPTYEERGKDHILESKDAVPPSLDCRSRDLTAPGARRPN